MNYYYQERMSCTVWVRQLSGSLAGASVNWSPHATPAIITRPALPSLTRDQSLLQNYISPRLGILGMF